MDLTAENLDIFNEKLLDLTLPERLKLIFDNWENDLGMTSAFGYSGMILMYHIKDMAPDFPIYFIDTRCHFQETLDFVDLIKANWDLNIIRIASDKSDDEINSELGTDIHETNPDQCCQLRKVDPLLKIIKTKKIWLHALRRDQAASRQHLNFIEQDPRGVIKVYPLIDWTRDQCWDFIHKHKVPYHPMHDQGYQSIGCRFCTTKVKDSDHERAGRWVSFPDKTECGLHLN